MSVYLWKEVSMDGWMDGWMDTLMGEWIGGWVEGVDIRMSVKCASRGVARCK